MEQPWIDPDGWSHLHARCATTSGRTVAMHTRVSPSIADDEPMMRGYALDALGRVTDDDDELVEDALWMEWLTPLDYLAHRF